MNYNTYGYKDWCTIMWRICWVLNKVQFFLVNGANNGAIWKQIYNRVHFR